MMPSVIDFKKEQTLHELSKMLRDSSFWTTDRILYLKDKLVETQQEFGGSALDTPRGKRSDRRA